MLDKQSSTIQQRWTQSSGPSKSKSKLSNKCLKYQLSDCLTDINLVIDVTSSTGKVSVFRRSRTHQIFSAKHLSSFEQFEPLLVCTNSVKSLVYLIFMQCNSEYGTIQYNRIHNTYTYTIQYNIQSLGRKSKSQQECPINHNLTRNFFLVVSVSLTG